VERRKVVPVNGKNAYSWSRGIAPLILCLGSRCRWVVNIKLRPY